MCYAKTWKLLKQCPKLWKEVKNERFLIINGHHSIREWKELQKERCRDARKVELSMWDVVIVWTLDVLQLTSISKFYNSTNHLNHPRQTWGNQIISCRRIWISCKGASNSELEVANRNHALVFNIHEYTISFIVQWNLISNYLWYEDNSLLCRNDLGPFDYVDFKDCW